MIGMPFLLFREGSLHFRIFRERRLFIDQSTHNEKLSSGVFDKQEWKYTNVFL